MTKNKFKYIVLSIIALFIILSLWFLGLKSMIDSFEIMTFDWRARLATDNGLFSSKFKNADSNVVLLSADDYTFQKLSEYPELGLGRWPLPRKAWGDVINFISKENPKAIVFDVKFEGTEGSLAVNIQSDKAFADSIKNKNVILGIAASYPRMEIKDQVEKLVLGNNIPESNVDEIVYKALGVKSVNLKETFGLNVSQSPIKSSITNGITFYGYSSIYDLLLNNVNNVGVINLAASENMIARYNMPIYRLIRGNKVIYLPSLSLSAVLSTLPESEKKSIAIKNNKVVIGKRVIPIDNEGKTLINWHGIGGTYKHYPLVKALLSDAYNKGIIKTINKNDYITPDIFKNKIIVIGQTSAGTDIHSTPMEMTYPGPEIIATAIDNYLNDADTTNNLRRKFIQKPPVYLDLFFALVLSSLIALAIIKSRSIVFGISSAFLLITMYIIVAIISFVHPSIRIWLNMSYPLLFLSITALISTTYKIQIERRGKKNVENLFGKFVSPQVLDKLLNDPSSIHREGQRKYMSVLFSDIRGFTTLSEKIPAQELIPQLNEYLSEMVEVVLKHDGTMDKFIGDAVMAFYGDPLPMKDHALKAVLTAIDMKKALNKLNEKWKSEGKQVWEIGVGVNSGEMIVGHMGSARLVDYTVIGDNVNLASRLESLNKEYKTGIIISESTYNEVKENIEAVYLDDVKVKGKEISVKIYEVKGLKGE